MWELEAPLIIAFFRKMCVFLVHSEMVHRTVVKYNIDKLMKVATYVQGLYSHAEI